MELVATPTVPLFASQELGAQHGRLYPVCPSLTSQSWESNMAGIASSIHLFSGKCGYNVKTARGDCTHLLVPQAQALFPSKIAHSTLRTSLGEVLALLLPARVWGKLSL